jgi:cytochrome c biogenesis protein CcmG/thiol:disulfide interchange protein DsbE
MRRRPVLLLAALALVAVVVVGLLQSGGDAKSSSARTPTAAQLRERLAGAPAPLAKLHARGNQLLDAAGARAELAALRGYPVVVNKWASWCGPCRAEFPTFQEVSADLGKKVAFLGLNAGDGRGPAMEFLRGYPTSFPSIFDPNLKAAADLGIAGSYWPTTAFFDATGKQTYVHQGPYLTAAGLRADIEKHTGA